MDHGSTSGRHRADTSRTGGLRGDIEGLRALAVGSVLLYHAGLAWVPGGFVGVDVFFVISGFLITSLMIREVERDGRLRLGAFWARRARRLLPASTIVLVFSAVITVLWLPVTARRDFGGDIVAAALYVVNWRLGYREVDYLAEGVGTSPVQHYWSLAVEEQFYVVWPLLLGLVVALVAARLRRMAIFLAVLALSVASFAWSVHYSADQPGLAFFVTTTRLWELGVGALLAVAWPVAVRLPGVVRAVLGWAGVGAVVFAALAYDHATVWPGWATLVPVLGTAAAILAGGSGMERRLGVGRVLAVAPAVWVGGLSYSLYLWHWPFLVAAEGIWGSDLRVRHTLLVTLVSVVPAWLSYRYVENPIRHSRRFSLPAPALRMGALGTAAAGVAGIAVIASFALVDTAEEASAAEAPGAVALTDARFENVDWTSLEKVERLRPSPLEAATDRPDIYKRDCVANLTAPEHTYCEFADLDSPRTVVLVGDSKAVQWFTPVEEIAERAGWRLVVIARGNCQFADVVRLTPDGQPSPACEEWSGWALDRIEQLRPDVVLTVTRWNRAMPEGGTSIDDYTSAAMVEGLVRHWRAVIRTGAVLVPILDTVGPSGTGMLDCVQENLDRVSACNYRYAPKDKTSGATAQRAAARQVPQARVVDMSDIVCPDGVTCPPVIGNVLVYRTGSHISDTYAATARPLLAERLAKATGGLLDGR